MLLVLTEFSKIILPLTLERKQTLQAQSAVQLKDLGQAYFTIFRQLSLITVA